MRIDKWLWCARIFKTRSLASKTVRAGKVRVNNIKAKPAREVSVSDFVKFQLGGLVVEYEVLKIPNQRGSASEAAKIYKETNKSIERRDQYAKEKKLIILESHLIIYKIFLCLINYQKRWK